MNPAPKSCLIPERIKFFNGQQVFGVSTAPCHSAAWNSKKLFTWGLNGGQLGHGTHHGNHIITPKVVQSINVGESVIVKVVSSYGAIAVLTGKGDVYVLHQYMCRKIASR